MVALESDLGSNPEYVMYCSVIKYQTVNNTLFTIHYYHYYLYHYIYASRIL